MATLAGRARDRLGHTRSEPHLIAAALAAKPLVGLGVLAWSGVGIAPLIAFDPWPSLVPCVMSGLFLAAGLELMIADRSLAWIRGSTLLLGACYFADVPLKIAGMHWPSFGALFWPVAFVDLALLIAVERRSACRPTAPILAGAVGLSFLELVTGPLPMPLFYAHGVAATGLAVWAAVRSLSDFSPV